MNKNLNGRIEALEAAIPPPVDTLAAELAAINEQLALAGLGHKLEWIRAELATLPADSDIHTLFIDWLDFLALQGDPGTVPGFDRDKGHFTPTDKSRRWSEIMSRWGWECWTGVGLPPQLVPGHWLCVLEGQPA